MSAQQTRDHQRMQIPFPVLLTAGVGASTSPGMMQAGAREAIHTALCTLSHQPTCEPAVSASRP